MQAIKLDLNQCICGDNNSVFKENIKLSLKPFINFLKDRISREKTARINFYNYMLDQFNIFPELMEPIPSENSDKYNHLFELIYTALSPVINDEHEQLWALSKPIYPCFYYGTNSFYNILIDTENGRLRTDLTLPSKEKMDNTMLVNFYNLILQKFYNFTISTEQHTVHSVVDQETQLQHYYRLNVDSRFLDIQAKMPLPELTLQNVKEYMKDESHSIDILKRLLPPEMFSIEGISIVNFTDVTAEYALEEIKNTIIDHNQCQVGWSSSAVSRALKSVVGTNQIEFSLLPYITLNNKTVLYNHDGFQSIIIQEAINAGIGKEEYTALVNSFVHEPRRLIFPEVNVEEYSTYPMLKLIVDSGIKSYALFPLYYNAKLVGGLEMYTRDPAAFNGNTLSRIESAFPLLSHLFQNIIIDFNNEINNIVTDKFTALQASVQWRFNEAAYNYMESGGWEKNLPVEPVYFKDVHPFYGAIDIRNSSIERNLMIRKDMYTHFQILQATLHDLKAVIPGNLEQQFPKQTILNKKGFEDMSDREIMKTDDYLQRQLPPYLKLLTDVHPEVQEIIQDYFKLTSPGGKVFEHRDNYELSMQMINHAVNRHLDEFNTEIQSVYPCYFEKFRTDGVEFDIYLGHSIAPDLKYTDELLHDFRFRQLKVIAEITRTTANMTMHLPLHLETTQLIFVYGKVIDISFRIDEQRFDVEGSYNIRYQMVKKRIDKAHIKDSTERLTQPGKISIVYFDSAEAQEYLGYIRKLQQQQLLTDLVEYIEVEELQGVEGLKALRVEVAMNNL